MLLLGEAQPRLIDYSEANYIPIVVGSTAIVNGFGYLTHRTNVSEFEAMAYETLNIAETLGSDGKLALKMDAQQILHLTSTLRFHHRQVRSFNALGTMLKYVAGTPDFDDFNRLQNNQNRVLENNERQFSINTELQGQINNLTDIINSILSNEKKLIEDDGHVLEVILHRNQFVIMELTNVINSISLAKLKIVNPILLNDNEIEKLILSDGFDNVSIADVINDSSIKAVQSNDVLFFLIKYPIIQKVCEKINIFPVVHMNAIINFETNDVAKCVNQFTPLKNCKKTLFSSFCETQMEANCVSSLLSNSTALCSSTSAFHIPPIQILDDGILILNNVQANIKEEGAELNRVNGTFVVLYENSVFIDNVEYVNNKKSSYMSPQVPMSQRLNITEHVSLLSLPYLHHVSSKNVEHIMNLQQNATSQSVVMYILFISTILVVIIIGSLLVAFKKQSDELKTKLRERQVQQTIEMIERAVDASAREGG